MKILMVFAMVLMAGCTSSSPNPPTTLVIPTKQAPAPAALPTPANIPISPTLPATPLPPTLAKATPSPQTPSKFILQVTAPEDEAVVNSGKIMVVGKTLPGAVVSVNGDLAAVDVSGKFQYTLLLEDGPNIIEVVASNMNGDELSDIICVIYQP